MAQVREFKIWVRPLPPPARDTPKGQCRARKICMKQNEIVAKPDGVLPCRPCFKRCLMRSKVSVRSLGRESPRRKKTKKAQKRSNIDVPMPIRAEEEDQLESERIEASRSNKCSARRRHSTRHVTMEDHPVHLRRRHRGSKATSACRPSVPDETSVTESSSDWGES